MKKFYIKEETKEKLLNTFEWLLVGISMWVIFTWSYSFIMVDLNDYSLIHELELNKEGLSLAEYFKEIYEKPFLLTRFFNIFWCKEACYFYIILYILWNIRNEWFGNPFAIKKTKPNSWNNEKLKVSFYKSKSEKINLNKSKKQFEIYPDKNQNKDPFYKSKRKKVNLNKSKKQFEIHPDKNQNKDPFSNFTDLDWDTHKNRI